MIQTVEQAAIRESNGKIYTLTRPNRHNNIMWKMVKDDGCKTPILGEQGFLLSDGKFVNRIEAGIYAIKSGQCLSLKKPPFLFTEDLW